MTHNVQDFIRKAEHAIRTGTEQEALDHLQALTFYVGHGAMSREDYNKLRRILAKRFPKN